MTVDKWKASQSYTPGLASLCQLGAPAIPVALRLDVCGHRRTLKILAFPGSGQARCPNSRNTALSLHLSCPHKISKSAISAGQSPGRSQNGSQGPLGTYTHHCLSLGRPSAPCLCLRGPGSPPSWSSSVWEVPVCSWKRVFPVRWLEATPRPSILRSEHLRPPAPGCLGVPPTVGTLINAGQPGSMPVWTPVQSQKDDWAGEHFVSAPWSGRHPSDPPLQERICVSAVRGRVSWQPPAVNIFQGLEPYVLFFFF